MLNKQTYDGYAKLLKNWVVFSGKHLYTCPERPEFIAYGAGEHGHWGVHTHQKAFSAFAIAATSKDIDFSDTEITKELVLKQALAMLRYTLHTHLEGDFVCTDGQKWGHNWIYVLGIERMYHAIEAIEKYLTADDKALLKKVIISEAEFILNDYEIKAGLGGVTNMGKNVNKPESNIWNGAILYRAAALYPDAPNKDKYIEKAKKFFANGISIESDENSDEIVDGVRIGDVFVGANMFDTFACNHHRYLNIGYMTICLSNIAMLHFFLKGKGIKPSDMIYHNLKGQWKLIYSTTFSDGRLWRIGGDSRARYCYCQDYALPSWALIEDLYGEDLSGFFDGWLEILQKETTANADGSFLSERFGHFERLSPVYYTRLESDRANVLSMVVYWHNKFGISGKSKSDEITNWSDEFHGAAFVKGDNRLASFSWESAEKPQGMLLPADDSSLAEWRFNLNAKILGVGRKNIDEVQDKTVKTFDGGFITYGVSHSFSDDFLAEGQEKELMAQKFTAFAALPDNKTVLCVQYLKTLNRTFASEILGTYWNVPNDIFNGCTRTAYAQSGEYTLEGKNKEYNKITLGEYVNFDNKIGLVSKIPLTLVRRAGRQVVIRNRPNSATLYAEEICAPFVDECQWIDRGTVVVDTAFAMNIGTKQDTHRLKSDFFTKDTDAIRMVGVNGFTLVANVSDTETQIEINGYDLASGQKVSKLTLSPNQAVLLRTE